MKKYFVGIKGGRFETFEADRYEREGDFVNFKRDDDCASFTKLGEVVGSVNWFSIDYIKLYGFCKLA